MFGKKRQEGTGAPALETNSIKENIGNVSNSNMMDIGMDVGPQKPPRPVPFKLLARPEDESYREEPEPLGSAGKSAPPLFIKIDRYRELVKNISELKSYSLSLRDALDALADIEKELKNGLDITHKALDRIANALTLLDSKLLRVGSEDEKDFLDMPREMDEYVKNLYDRVERIKHELRTSSE